MFCSSVVGGQTRRESVEVHLVDSFLMVHTHTQRSRAGVGWVVRGWEKAVLEREKCGWTISSTCWRLIAAKFASASHWLVVGTYTLRTSCIISKNWYLLFRRLASSFAFWMGEENEGKKRWSKLKEQNWLGSFLILFKLRKRLSRAKISSNCSPSTVLTLFKLFWKRLVIWPVRRFDIISLAEWCGDTSSTVLMNLYNFCSFK